MTCKGDCIHYEVCEYVSYTSTSIEETCKVFKNKSDFIRIEDIKAVKSETIKRVCEELRKEAFEDRLGFRIVLIDQITNLEEKMMGGLK